VAKRLIVTIDGPAGAGKSTVGRKLAQALGYLYLDSGALYRAVAWQADRLSLDLDRPGVLAPFLAGLKLTAAPGQDGFRLWVDGREVGEELRSPEVSRQSSRVALRPEVRLWVTDKLRAWGRDGGVVAEGRDQGSVVFPQAQIKFYLDATLAVRAQRRRRDWHQDGDPPPLDQVKAELAARDRQDTTRKEGPLTVPPGAVLMDTTEMSPEEVVNQCLARIKILLDPDGLENKPV